MKSYVRSKLKRTLQSKSKKSRLRERANISFFLVVFFFVIFGLILIAEVFFIDDKNAEQVYLSDRNGKNFHSDYDELANGEMDRLAYVLGEMRDTWKPEEKEGGKVEAGAGGQAAAADEAQDYREMVHLVEQRESIRASAPPAPPPPPPPAPAGPLPSAHNASAKDAEWQPVGGTRFKFFVYSAYYDARVGHFVRVIGATKTKGAERVWCVFWYGGPDVSVVPGAVKVIRENWNLKYSACFIMCPLYSRELKTTLRVPARVSVVSSATAAAASAPYNLLLVRNANLSLAATPPEFDFSVCVKPLHFHYNQPLQMLEFLELNGLLGVQRFTFYNHTVGPQVDCLLQHYAREGIVQILPWQLDILSQKEIRTEGLFAALNDCLYRHMFRSRYLLLIDLDEFILPHQNDSLQGLLRRLQRMAEPRSIGAYSFQNAFFYLQWPDDPLAATVAGPRLLTLLKTRRRAKLHPHKQRSKYICVPSKVLEAGNHFVWEMVSGARSLPVPPDAAFLHHYRVCEFGGDDCVKSASLVDRSAHRFGERLRARVAARLRQLHACGLGEDLQGLGLQEWDPTPL